MTGRLHCLLELVSAFEYHRIERAAQMFDSSCPMSFPVPAGNRRLYVGILGRTLIEKLLGTRGWNKVGFLYIEIFCTGGASIFINIIEIKIISKYSSDIVILSDVQVDKFQRASVIKTRHFVPLEENKSEIKVSPVAIKKKKIIIITVLLDYPFFPRHRESVKTATICRIGDLYAKIRDDLNRFR